MTKSTKELSSNEKKILNVLAENARHSLITISEKTGLSRQTVQKTITKLEDENVIWGYQVITDESKSDLSNYLVLIKRTAKPLDEKIAEKIISRRLEDVASKIGVKIITSMYCHGNYDWVISLQANNIIQAKKLIEELKLIYSDYLEEVQLIETLFFVKKQGFKNPEVELLKQFV